MSKIIVIVFVTIFVCGTVASCATPANTSATTAVIGCGNRMTPGVRREGDTVISVECVTSVLGVPLAQSAGEWYAREKAIKSTCPSGQGKVVVSRVSHEASAGYFHCVEVTFLTDDISCKPTS